MTAVKVGESLMVSVRPGAGVRIMARNGRLEELAAAARKALGNYNDLAKKADDARSRGIVLIVDVAATTVMEVAAHCTRPMQATLLAQAATSLADYHRTVARDCDALAAHVTGGPN